MPLHLFQGYGVELEYMIVDRETLAIKPIADEILKAELGSYGSDFVPKNSTGEDGIVTWSNELVMHVIELKSTKPESDFAALEPVFVENVQRINNHLVKWNAQLMPTAAHPFMNPHTEAILWPHDNNEVYEVYNRIFDCRGHGWSNLQSTHLNLPFHGDIEFAKLHAAIRLVLPLLPALCASSPFIDGRFTGIQDTRLRYYKENQKKIPSITGKVIPEQVFSEKHYQQTVYDVIQSDIKPFDSEDVLDPIWVNSRGAIARFDRGSIEIRLMDVQECPAADLAIVTFVIEMLKAFTNEIFISETDQMNWHVDPLDALLSNGIVHAEKAVYNNQQYLEIFGLRNVKSITAGELLLHIYEKLAAHSNRALERKKTVLMTILKQGSLSTRLLNATGDQPDVSTIEAVYRKLSKCLAENRMFTQ
jgi:carboxylate-amine ligase